MILKFNQPGFSGVLSSSTVITHIAYSLHTSSLKVRTLSTELLAAICVLSLTDGHRAVLSAMSDYRIAYDETFRFETLIGSLKLPEFGSNSDNNGGDAGGEEGVWEARTAAMTLVNAITTCPDALEDRILLREEFSRRGLNEVIVVRSLSTDPYFSPDTTNNAGFAIYQTPGLPPDAIGRIYGREI